MSTLRNDRKLATPRTSFLDATKVGPVRVGTASMRIAPMAAGTVP